MFSSRDHVWRQFWLVWLRQGVHLAVEARNLTKHPLMLGTAPPSTPPPAKTDVAQSVRSA